MYARQPLQGTIATFACSIAAHVAAACSFLFARADRIENMLVSCRPVIIVSDSCDVASVAALVPSKVEYLL